MKLIIGLGNPGLEYDKTRHNAGFFVIDKVLSKLNLKLDKKRFKSLYTYFNYQNEKIFLMKPQTYMNNSGEAVISLMKYYDISYDDIIVIHDDLDLALGSLRIREKGSSGGQKGMHNIIDLLGTKEIKRIRIGISNDKNIDTKNYVLGHFNKEEFKIYDDITNIAAKAVIFAFDHNFEIVMNEYNIKI